MQNQTTTKLGYKQSPLGIIPNDWNIVKLGEKSDITTGKLDANAMVENGKYRFYTCAKDFYYIDDYEFDTEALLISGNGAHVGYVHYYKGKFNAYQRTYVLDNFKENIFYVKYFLEKNLRKRIYGEKNEGNTPYIVYNTLHNMDILTPPLPEQQAIARILGKVDETIEKAQNMIEKLELRNKGLEQKLLKNDNQKEIKLGNLFERVTDKNSEGNTNVVTISAQKGFIKQNDFFNKFVASETLDNYYLVKKGEFCYNKSYSNGYPMGAIKRLNDFDKAVVTTLYICFKIKDLNKTSGDFFEYYFDAGLLDKGLTQIAYEGGRAHGLLNVSPNDFFNLKIRVPEFEEQKAIANILNKANEQLNKYEQKLEKLQELKKGLMQQLLTGKVRVKEFRN